MREEGGLVLVATPIGNMGDISRRAIEVLGAADAVYCEDTRHSGQLFSRVGIRPARVSSLHEHNEAQRLREILDLLAEGKTVALVTDAGTPAISDPGSRVVAAAHDAGRRVTAVPGPSACVTAVALAGLAAGRWRFEGFLPRKGRDRRERLGEIASSGLPSVIYESPRRVEALLDELAALCDPARLLVVCRELTKLHEEVWRGPLSGSSQRWPSASARGEFVLVLDGAEAARTAAPAPQELVRAVGELIDAGATRRDAVAEVAGRFGLARREVYDAAGSVARRPRAGAL